MVKTLYRAKNLNQYTWQNVKKMRPKLNTTVVNVSNASLYKHSSVI